MANITKWKIYTFIESIFKHCYLCKKKNVFHLILKKKSRNWSNHSFNIYIYIKLTESLTGSLKVVSTVFENGRATFYSQSYLIMQRDNNLVLYNSPNEPTWNTQTHSDPNEYSAFFINQYGNLYLQAHTGKILWSLITNG